MARFLDGDDAEQENIRDIDEALVALETLKQNVCTHASASYADSVQCVVGNFIRRLK